MWRPFVVGMLAALGCGPRCEEVLCDRVGRAGCLACDREERGATGHDGEQYCNIVCSSFVTCGNGWLDPGEICDDGPWGSGQLGCAADCASTTCGDQAASPGEVCLVPEVFTGWTERGIAHDMDGDGLTDLVFGDGVIFHAPDLVASGGVDLESTVTFGMVALELDGAPPAELVFRGSSRLEVVSMVTTPGQVIATIPEPGTGRLVAGDIDADGDVDVVSVRGSAGTGTPTATIVRNDGAGGLAAEPPSECAGTLLGNLDDDPDLELAGFGTREIHVCDLVGGRYVAAPPMPVDLHGSEAQPRLGDLDGDGDPDLLWRLPDVRIAMAPGGPGLTFAAPFVLHESVGGSGYLGAIVDLDGDGASDVLLEDGTILRMTAARTATPVGALATALPPFDRVDGLRISTFDVIGPVFADLDGDGHLDVAADGVVLRSSP